MPGPGARDDGGSSRAASTSATTPNGTLTKKIQRQPSGSPATARITPPTTGPTAVESPTVAPNRPNARPRSAPRNRSWMSAEFCGASEPGGQPLRQPGDDQQQRRRREPGEHAGDHERGQRDQVDPPPAERVAEAAARDQREAERQRVAGHHPLHAAAAEPRPCWMDGTATVTMLTSSRIMNPAASVTLRARQRRGSGSSLGAAEVGGRLGRVPALTPACLRRCPRVWQGDRAPISTDTDGVPAWPCSDPRSTPIEGAPPADLVIEDITAGDGPEARPGGVADVHFAAFEFDRAGVRRSWNRGRSLGSRSAVDR